MAGLSMCLKRARQRFRRHWKLFLLACALQVVICMYYYPTTDKATDTQKTGYDRIQQELLNEFNSRQKSNLNLDVADIKTTATTATSTRNTTTPYINIKERMWNYHKTYAENTDVSDVQIGEDDFREHTDTENIKASDLDYKERQQNYFPLSTKALEEPVVTKTTMSKVNYSEKSADNKETFDFEREDRIPNYIELSNQMLKQKDLKINEDTEEYLRNILEIMQADVEGQMRGEHTNLKQDIVKDGIRVRQRIQEFLETLEQNIGAHGYVQNNLETGEQSIGAQEHAQINLETGEQSIGAQEHAQNNLETGEQSIGAQEHAQNNIETGEQSIGAQEHAQNNLETGEQSIGAQEHAQNNIETGEQSIGAQEHAQNNLETGEQSIGAQEHAQNGEWNKETELEMKERITNYIETLEQQNKGDRILNPIDVNKHDVQLEADSDIEVRMAIEHALSSQLLNPDDN